MIINIIVPFALVIVLIAIIVVCAHLNMENIKKIIVPNNLVFVQHVIKNILL